MTTFAKSPIVTVRLGCQYISVIFNLISTSATQLYSKTTKTNEIFIGSPHFFLKLVQKFKNEKSWPFPSPLSLQIKTNSCQMSHLHRLSSLYLMSLMHRKDFLCIFSPGHLIENYKSLHIVSFTHIDVISDERPKLSTKWRISRKSFWASVNANNV